jgi:hypothetical protein
MFRKASTRNGGFSGWLKDLLYKIVRPPGYEPIRFYLRSRREQHNRMTF